MKFELTTVSSHLLDGATTAKSFYIIGYFVFVVPRHGHSHRYCDIVVDPSPYTKRRCWPYCSSLLGSKRNCSFLSVFVVLSCSPSSVRRIISSLSVLLWFLLGVGVLSFLLCSRRRRRHYHTSSPLRAAVLR